MPQTEKPSKETLDNWHKDPNNWKWGCIYYNKADKRIFPPKRNPFLGWTVNFSNPLSIITLVVIVLAIVLISTHLEAG